VATTVEKQKPPSVAGVLERAKAGVLVGRRCTGCGKVYFIDQLRCEVCRSQDFVAFESKGEGEILSYTIISFPAEPFAPRAPYAFVVVKMVEGGATTGWMPDIKDARQLKVGDKVRVIPSPSGLGIAYAKA